MVRRSNRLPLLVLAGAMLVLIIGCSESDDVVTPISSTEITLSAERLPSPPTGMVYELWLAGVEDTTSLGKFSYDGTNRRFLSPGGGAHPGVFTLNDDIMLYRSLFVSVEHAVNDDPISHGPIMLIDDVRDPDGDPFELVFPNSDSLWRAYVRFNMESVSDRNRGVGDGKGLWFSRYQVQLYTTPDTTGLRSIDTTEVSKSTDEPYTYLCAIVDVETTTTLVEMTYGQIYMSPTPLQHTGMSWGIEFCTDSIPPIEGKVVVPRFWVSNRLDTIDWFSQDGFGLPDYSEWGWKYKGWVVLQSYNDVPMTTRWRLTTPAYRYKSAGQNFIPGDDGVMFTTGTFARYDEPDDANPYVGAGPVPPFPGEDFINSAVLQNSFGLDEVDILQGTRIGTIFISLEPDNALHDTTNFPLLAFTRPLPARSEVTGGNVQLSMYNRTATPDGDLYAPGFPQINVNIKRF